MEISINEEIEFFNLNLEKHLEKTNTIAERHHKNLLYSKIIEKHKDQYIKRQKRIIAFKSPFVKARGVLQGILGESIENIQEEEVIDLTGLKEENQKTRNIINTLNYRESIKYFGDTQKHNLNRVNKNWKKKLKR